MQLKEDILGGGSDKKKAKKSEKPPRVPREKEPRIKEKRVKEKKVKEPKVKPPRVREKRDLRWTPWPLALSLVLFAAGSVWLMLQSMRFAHGWFIYPLDDTYIHMAMAKNIVQHGVWGVTQYGFTGSSSSPIWTLLLAGAYALTGVHIRTPWAFNLLFSVLLLIYVDIALYKAGRRGWTRFWAQLALLFVTPLVVVSFAGMEHVLHVLLAVIFLHQVSLHLDEVRQVPVAARATLVPILALLLVGVRYEGLALALTATAFFWMRRDRGYALLMAVCTLLPVAAYAVFARMHGSTLLPDATYLKSVTAPVTGLEDWIFWHIFNPQILNLLPVAISFITLLLVYRRYHRYGTAWETGVMAGLLLAIATAAHMVFSTFGHFYRTEAYVYAMNIFVAFWIWPEELPELYRRARSRLTAWPELIALLLLAFFLYPAIHNGLKQVYSLYKAPIAAHNIYDQQYQMARFVARHFNGEAVALNDIGAVAFFTKSPIVDVYGLGSEQVIPKKLNGTYNSSDIEQMVRESHAQLAIINTSWLDGWGGVPSDWVKVGDWTIPNNVVCYGATVSIYATEPAYVERIARALQSFEPLLPKEVTQTGLYLETGFHPSSGGEK